MAYTLTGYDGKGVARPLQMRGQFAPLVAVKITISGTVTSQAISIPGLATIQGAIVQVLDSGNNVVTTDADVTWSGNTLTLANGSTFDLDASGQTIYALIWGQGRG